MPTSLIRPDFVGPPSPAGREKERAERLRDAAQDIGTPEGAGAEDAPGSNQCGGDPLASLRNRQLGAKFRRQVPVGAFIADFACVEALVAVEVDGLSHEDAGGAKKDAWRDRWFAENGWQVVRVPNALAIGGGDLALAPIKAALKERARR